MGKKLLIKEFAGDKNVGAIAPSSNKVVENLLSRINFSKKNILLEYGPGTGVITKQILNLMHKDSTLFVFETNNEFTKELLKIKDNRLKIITEDAEKSLNILKERYEIENVDYIISTIPFSFFSRRKRRRIIFKAFTLLKENGKFITYQYTWLVYHIIKERFLKHNIKPMLLNIPPAFVMEGVK